MFGEFNEATQLKTSLAKYSIEFNDLAVQMRPHRIAYLRLLGRPYTLLCVKRSVGRLPISWFQTVYFQVLDRYCEIHIGLFFNTNLFKQSGVLLFHDLAVFFSSQFSNLDFLKFL